MKPLPLLIINTITFALTLGANFIAGAGVGEIPSVGEISDQYPSLLTPAGYAFSIWGIIYLMLGAFLVYQWVGYAKGNNQESLLPSGAWFALSNVFNITWLLVWVHGYLGLAAVVIALLLFSLIKLVIRLRLEIWDAPLRHIAFVWWPICIYTGWIVLATVLNISIFLNQFGVLEQVFAEEVWAALIIPIAMGVYLYLTFRRNMREAALVGVWGLVAVGVNQPSPEGLVAVVAWIAAGVLFLAAGYHGFKNMGTSPLMKIKKER
ncbi:TspO/MBR family protein [Pleomorphovibrio marinus]|uniref:TspO/MBR family protein n=1 Tax=Pleomorphovibrio marinus TaxID=2164132 RepID=UPI000E0B32A2|nr:TspO/MBR family protein [Pleomorphovibrio marinus]